MSSLDRPLSGDVLVFDLEAEQKRALDVTGAVQARRQPEVALQQSTGFVEQGQYVERHRAARIE